MSEQQSSGCSACDQLGQVPTDEHLAGVARFEARQQVAPSGHRQNDEYPAFCRCLSRWPCELAADELAAENERLRERVAALESAMYKRHRTQGGLVCRGCGWPKGGWSDGTEGSGGHARRCWVAAALAGQEPVGGAR